MVAVVKSGDGSVFRNAILRALPIDVVEALLPHLDLVGIERQQILNAAGVVPEQVYFPEGGILSFVIPMPSSGQVEFGLLGRDGLSSLSAAWSDRASPVDVVVQVGDVMAYTIDAKILRRVHRDSEAFRLQFLEALYGFAGQMAYTAISNARHTLPQRLARWLLLCHDRLDGDEIPLTHDFMAMMLGSQRTSVTTTLHVLEGEGAIYSRRGTVEVRRRRRLEECAGEAYVSVRR